MEKNCLYSTYSIETLKKINLDQQQQINYETKNFIKTFETYRIKYLIAYIKHNKELENVSLSLFSIYAATLNKLSTFENQYNYLQDILAQSINIETFEGSADELRNQLKTINDLLNLEYNAVHEFLEAKWKN